MPHRRSDWTTRIGSIRLTPEGAHWAAIDRQLRETLGDAAYDAASAEGAELSVKPL